MTTHPTIDRHVRVCGLTPYRTGTTTPSSGQAESPYIEWYCNSPNLPGSAVARHHQQVYGDRPFENPEGRAMTWKIRRSRIATSGSRGPIWPQLTPR